MKIILIDDDEELLSLLKEYLSCNGIEVWTANSGEEGLKIIEEEQFDLVVLDIMMPGMNGIDVLKYIMNRYNSLPVIILTARGDEVERILGLELGADDYIVKPFSSRELLARIKAVVRRQVKLKQHTKAEVPLNIAVVQLDLKKRQAIVNGDLVELSSIEFDILSIFVQNKGIVLSRERIMDLARGKNFIALDRSIDVQVSRLRQKLERNPQKPELIKTVWGVGYLFVDGS